jgi:two-component system, OmpR family, phosphate regulon sensor histidine kinase PhoR
MRKATVLQIIVASSLVVSILLTIVLFVVQYFFTSTSLGDESYIIFFFSCLILSAGVMYFLVFKFFNDKLKVIYRIIYDSKNPLKSKKSDLTVDPFNQTLKEVTEWSSQNEKEFERLKYLEEFRREFVGNVAHELKTPVFTVQGYLLTLLDGGLDDSELRRKFLERAYKGVDRMTKIIEDLDTINQIESQKIDLDITKFDIVELTKEVMDELEILAKEKNISLGFDKLPATKIMVKADRRRISQVLLNLISNSLHYGKENGFTKIRFYDIDNQVLVEVADNGPGIDEKHLPRLFERFYRVDKSRARNEGGTGLGLAIVKHIVEAHGQTVKARSTVDVGSTFSFTLPRA